MNKKTTDKTMTILFWTISIIGLVLIVIDLSLWINYYYFNNEVQSWKLIYLDEASNANISFKHYLWMIHEKSIWMHLNWYIITLLIIVGVWLLLNWILWIIINTKKYNKGEKNENN